MNESTQAPAKMPPASNTQSDVPAIAALATSGLGARAIAPGAAPFIIVPEGYVFKDVESTLEAPTRKRGFTKLADAESFIRFVNMHKSTMMAPVIYGAIDASPSFKAVMNPHQAGDGSPGWADFGATYECPMSVEWERWTVSNGKRMKQADFAAFIEDNAPDCVSPDAATMIEIARTLEARKSVNFASGVRLSNGANEITYEETINGSAAKGRLSIPEIFTIGIAPLVGVPPYEVRVRLRYRIEDGGKLSMWYELDRPHKVIEDAVKDVWKRIEGETGVLIYRINK